MANLEVEIDGQENLQEQQTDVRTPEVAGLRKLVKYEKAQPKKNIGTYEEIDPDPDNQLPELVLVEVPPGQDEAKVKAEVAKVKAQQEALGLTFVCEGPAYVNGKESRVAVFRKAS